MQQQDLSADETDAKALDQEYPLRSAVSSTGFYSTKDYFDVSDDEEDDELFEEARSELDSVYSARLRSSGTSSAAETDQVCSAFP